MADKVIWKFPLAMTDCQSIDMPEGAEVLSAALQVDSICLWAKVNPEAPKEKRAFWIHGTGHPFRDDHHGRHIATVLIGGGSLVFHVFEYKV